MLSSRTRDEKTIEAVKRLMKKFKNAKEICQASPKDIEKCIYGVGFYRVKAKKLKELSCMVKSGIPNNYEELIKLPGVGRKTAHVFLSEKGEAIGVDVHVHRIANRLGLVNTKAPEETEEELRKIAPRHLWKRLNKAFVGFGQTICKAKPLCNTCPLRHVCKYRKKERD